MFCRRSFRKLAATMVTLLLLGLTATSKADEPTKQHLQKLLAERFSDISVLAIYESADLPGYYEIVTPTEIVYSDASGARLFVGRVMDTATRENLTDKRWNDLNRVDFNALPFDKAIKIVKGKGSRKLAIFEDPFCPFCKEFEKTLHGLTDVTLYIFLFPLESIHPGATAAAKDIWCAPDRAKAWTDWMSQDKQPESRDCKNVPVDELVELGDKLNIFATPTIVFSNGTRAPGVISAERLQQGLEASTKSK